jgi:hypothetical protein
MIRKIVYPMETGGSVFALIEKIGREKVQRKVSIANFQFCSSLEARIMDNPTLQSDYVY